MTNYSLEFGMDCVEIGPRTYERLLPKLESSYDNPWTYIMGLDHNGYWINLNQIKFIKELEE